MPRKRKDLTGLRFGRLAVLHAVDDIDRHSAWRCLCDCGNEKIVSVRDLLRKNPTLSCGCWRIESARERMTKLSPGQTFHDLTTIEYLPDSSSWLCRCRCGNTVARRANLLIKGLAKSCGCGRRTSDKRVGEKIGKLTIVAYLGNKKGRRYLFQCECGTTKSLSDGTAKRGKFKGCKCNPLITRHPLRSIISSAIRRCHNPSDTSYMRYGGRGIHVFPEWRRSPIEFCKWADANLGPRPDGWSLDRIDNDGHYEPGNLRWADSWVQNKNRRISIAAREDRQRIKQVLIECLSVLYGNSNSCRKFTG